MRYYLYKFSDNGADEMDLEGFAILTETEKNTALSKIKREFKRGGTISFGTNEDNEYSSLRDLMNCVEFKSITHSEYKAINKAFGRTYMGQLGPLDIYDLEDEEEFCDNCGEYLDLEDNDGLCETCAEEESEDAYEEQYEEMADEQTLSFSNLI